MKSVKLSSLIICAILLAGCSTQKDLSKDQIYDSEQYLRTYSFFVDDHFCKTSSLWLSMADFQKKCKYIAETQIEPDIKVRVIEDLPKNAKPDQQIQIGESVHLEFYKNNKKMNIPNQSFHTFWATNFLALDLSYVDENNIYVQGSFFSEKPDPNFKYSFLNGGETENIYTYIYQDGKWSNFIPQDIVQDTARLELYASEKFIKFINARDCVYQYRGDEFYINYINGVLTGTEYILDAKTHNLVRKINKPCISGGEPF